MEILIYIFISSIFILLIFDFWTHVNYKIKNLSDANEAQVRAILVIDLIRRDLISVYSDKRCFDLENGIFRKYFLEQDQPQILDICWQVRKNRLERIEGVYDYSLKEWKNKKRSFASYNAKSIEFAMNNDDSSRGVGRISVKYMDLQDNLFESFV